VRPPGGLSLLEAIVATFLLLSSFLIIVNLFHSGMRYNTRIENQQLAAMLAERHLEQLRSWSELSTAGVYHYDNLVAIYHGATSVPADHPTFTLSTRVVDEQLYSPSSTLELGLPPGTLLRRLNGSARKVEVVVSWTGSQVAVTSLFSRPPADFRALNAITVSPVGSPSLPLAQNASADFRAEAFDSNDQAIPGLTYQWEIVPIDGNGTLVQARDGSTATLTNAVDVAGEVYHTGGSLYVRASARYHGRTVQGLSSVVGLQ